MNLRLDKAVTMGYTSGSQIARKLTESWVPRNAYCPACGNQKLISFENNNPVGDFYCGLCSSEYELKSKQNSFGQKIVDGAYTTMIRRIHSNNNPHFFFLNYSLNDLTVRNFLVIPNHFFVDEIIEKRKPLSSTAKRAGWTGCNILLSALPESGKIFFVKNGTIVPNELVIEAWRKTSFLSEQRVEHRGWTIEILRVVERMPVREFRLADVYAFESELKHKFPANQFVKDKIRQQLQVLRDQGIIEFLGKGYYRKL